MHRIVSLKGLRGQCTDTVKEATVKQVPYTILHTVIHVHIYTLCSSIIRTKLMPKVFWSNDMYLLNEMYYYRALIAMFVCLFRKTPSRVRGACLHTAYHLGKAQTRGKQTQHISSRGLFLRLRGRSAGGMAEILGPTTCICSSPWFGSSECQVA